MTVDVRNNPIIRLWVVGQLPGGRHQLFSAAPVEALVDLLAIRVIWGRPAVYGVYRGVSTCRANQLLGVT